MSGKRGRDVLFSSISETRDSNSRFSLMTCRLENTFKKATQIKQTEVPA
jgi:hypothetical protein